MSLLSGVQHAEQWVTSALALLLALLVWRLVTAGVERFYARRFFSRFIPRVSTYRSLSKSLLGALILYLLIVELLHIWSVNIAPALWSAAFVTAIIAFGAQAIVRDVLSGVFSLFEDTYDVGDGVEFTTTNGTVTGTVDAIGLRLTRVIDQYGRMVSIPNGSIVYVTNATRLPSRVTVKIQAPLRAAVAELRQRIADAVARSAPAAGVDPGSVAIWVDDASADAVTFSIEFEAVRATARAAEATLRESVLAALQSNRLLPGSPATPEGG